ncbi:aldehyde dehydrogenase family protein [Rhodoplanes sp. Z2-YC6860]|uniref:aldehyde dehydrogenase family protein n=1 Tax=Rhodoplanes sp. Z2-YC6860 TaxID=674703 RepID=UPI00078BE7E1|nr:aldehyde dehydrogenase family protein [Rhodoplanes sp. Z2-YC6860]AMN41823.1 NAD-dependent aldehyde dehydrogenase [Rhodoplanes sp. Z2-YC6860]
MSENDTKFYIDGAWVEPAVPELFDVINPATEEVAGQISLGSGKDVNRAVMAARKAFPAFSATSRDERLDLLQRIIKRYEERSSELSQAMTAEMGSPITFSNEVQTVNALGHFKEMVDVLKSYEFERFMGGTLIRREAIGVCGLITPWNWPLNQVTSKLAPALAAGCTVVLKPSEIAPLSTILLMEVLHDAGVPKGVVNLVNGDGPGVGAAISKHPDIDMVSFTGSTRAGILIAKAAAKTVKRVTQELGGKSPNIILGGVDLAKAVPAGVLRCYTNTGQSCQAPTRMLIHKSQRDEAVALAKKTAEQVKLGDPLDPATQMGPLVSKAQFDKVQGLIEKGIQEGATLVTGGPGRPAGFNRGYFVRPTVFADVTPNMTIAKEEIFGPVLSMMTYGTEDQAIKMANKTSYGLAGYVQAGDIADARRVATKIRAGRIYLNGAPANQSVPFGGYKQSGNGREHGVFGLEEYLEVKAVLGYQTA